jgi:hypothetical protein
MKIGIYDAKTRQKIYETDVVVGGLNYKPELFEAFAEAWKAAIEDGVVKEGDKEKYLIKRIEVLP